MTDNEIIKALECLTSGCFDCNDGCKQSSECPVNIISCALDLINRQKEQIKKLENIERFATKTIEKQEAEIERLKTSIKEADSFFEEGYIGKGLAVIINLVKEMTEGCENG